MSNYIDNIKKIALLSVLEPDDEAFIRYLYRWFSKSFHTPLPQVEDLPLDYILQHYYETIYEELGPDEKHNLIIYLLETPEEREKRKVSEAKSEEDFLKEIENEAKFQETNPEEYKKQQIALRKKGLKKPDLGKVLELEPDLKIKFDEEL